MVRTDKLLDRTSRINPPLAMTTIIIDYFDKRIQERRTIHMREDGGLFKYSLWDITLLYDNRTPASRYPWSCQKRKCVRYFCADFEVMKIIVNAWAEKLRLPFKLEYYGIVQSS